MFFSKVWTPEKKLVYCVKKLAIILIFSLYNSGCLSHIHDPDIEWNPRSCRFQHQHIVLDEKCDSLISAERFIYTEELDGLFFIRSSFSNDDLKVTQYR